MDEDLELLKEMMKEMDTQDTKDVAATAPTLEDGKDVSYGK